MVIGNFSPCPPSGSQSPTEGNPPAALSHLVSLIPPMPHAPSPMP
ncbi:hypothetical protein FDUTEX481_03786 [Tolypothrix sp. PCC 7601]|nr:hypothetical protein FDUTEX481_03786 [Tolypothrix sp. PCC 7601]